MLLWIVAALALLTFFGLLWLRGDVEFEDAAVVLLLIVFIVLVVHTLVTH